MKTTTPIKKLPLTMAVAMTLFGCSSLMLLEGHANATPFAAAFVRLDRLQAVTTTTGRVCAKPSTTNLSQTEASVQVTFPTTSGTDYALATQASGLWTVNTTNLDSGQTAWPGITAATAVSGKTVTFPSSDLTSSSTLYCFNFGTAGSGPLTTSSAGAAETTQGTVVTRTSAPATIDNTTYSESIISNDQVVLSAVVPPSFTFALSGNTDAFTSNLSTSSVVSTSGRTATITTNAASGWVVWVKDLNGTTNGALQSATASNYKIAGTTSPGSASHTLTTGTEDYGLGASMVDASGGGTVTLNSAYDGSGVKAGTLDPTQFRPVASANGTANGDTVTFTERATIAGQTPAANDYTDTMTVIGAGVF